MTPAIPANNPDNVYAKHFILSTSIPDKREASSFPPIE